jgi:hypothetical protein
MVYQCFQHVKMNVISHIHQILIVPFLWKYGTQLIDAKIAK